MVFFNDVLHSAHGDGMTGTQGTDARAALVARIAARYDFASRWDRFHVRHRLALCPYETLLPHLPTSGTVLDIGCGFGLLGQFLAETRPQLHYAGADVDGRKIAVARRSFESRSSKASASRGPLLFSGDVRTWTDRPAFFSAVLLLDVLYVVPEPLQKALLDFASRVLAPGPEAALVLKILPPLRGKARWRTFVQESIMIHLLRKTRSSGALFSSQDPGLYAGWGRALGFSCQQVDPHTHPPSVLLVFRRDT